MTFQIYSEANAPPESRMALMRAQRQMGYVPDLLGVFAESPALLDAYMAMDDAIKATTLTPVEREVALKTVGHMTHCAWCASAALSDGEDVPAAITRAAEQGQRLDDPKLEALRQYATSLMQNQGRPSDEAKQKFIEAGYGPRQALELVLAAGMMTMAAMAASLAHTALEARVRH